MALKLGTVHHLALTVTDVARSKAFYMNVLGFNHLVDLGPRAILGNGALVIALTPPSNPSEAVIHNDHLSENRVGLDHLSFGLASRADLEAAAQYFDQNGISHGTINDLGEVGVSIYVMAFRDLDNIQLELTAPHPS